MLWTETLIDLVLQHPALFNSTHQDYRNILKRDRIWDAIGNRLQTSGEDVKKKWRSLRDTYAKFLRRGNVRHGSRNYRKWVWADKMEPLRQFITSGADSDNIDVHEVKLEDESESHTQDTEGDFYFDNAEDTGTDEHQATSSENVDPSIDPIVPDVTLATTSSPKGPGNKRRYFSRHHCAQPSVETVMGYFEDDKRPKMDPIDLLFLAHASTVKTFSGKRQAITKLKIAQVIMEQEMLHQDELND